jgi:hypothetical protein
VSQFFKGYLTTQWKVYLDHELHSHSQTTSTNPVDSDKFFSGLIKAIWTQQSKFWSAHQQSLHTPTIPTDDPILLQELRLEIQHLYSLKSQVLAHHREHYFPSNLKHFLETSTITQLRTYITNYKPSIHQSIKSAKQLYSKTKKIDNYPGFESSSRPTFARKLFSSSSQRLPVPTSPPRPTMFQTTLPITLNTNTESVNPYHSSQQPRRHTRWKAPSIPTLSPNNSASEQREKPIRKHSRWKSLHTMQDRFKAFFLSSKKTNNIQTQP